MTNDAWTCPPPPPPPPPLLQLRFNLTGSQPGVLYVIRASALNSLGWGPLTREFRFKTLAV